uniref:Solute:sodium symporter family transporter n=2 Tax=Alexandrium monilatum TaxID=311494 RepID=A0A7S4USB6_9DINO
MDAVGLHICTFLAWTGGVALITWIICRCRLRTKAGAVEDYFAGGRSFAWYVISGSLLLTNLSTEQLVGLNGVVFADGCMAASAWETFASLAICIAATVFLPRYMQLGLTTTSGYLGERFDRATRTLVSVVLLTFYAVGLCPSVLYTAALAIRNILGIDGLPLWTISLAIGLLGSVYAIFGGLKGVAVSDCLNGIGLFIVGLWVPLAALQRIGGPAALFEHPQFLRPLVATSQVFDKGTGARSLGEPTLPWRTLLTGFMPINVYYWSMNQVIVQRALAAQSLAEGQKGVLFAACMKVVGFVTLCLPGVIGMIMIEKGIHVGGEAFTVDAPDKVYPELVKAVMPDWSFGFLAAVLLGSALSTYNSALNSASTLFALEVYRPYIHSGASDERTVKVAAVFGAALAIPSWIVAPQFEQVVSIFDFIRRGLQR